MNLNSDLAFLKCGSIKKCPFSHKKRHFCRDGVLFIGGGNDKNQFTLLLLFRFQQKRLVIPVERRASSRRACVVETSPPEVSRSINANNVKLVAEFIVFLPFDNIFLYNIVFAII